MVKRSSALVAVVAACVIAAPAQARTAANPFGLSVVRFANGTTPAQMRTAVAQAGGVVVTDLSPIGALVVVPASLSFGSRIQADRHVTAAFADSVVTPSPRKDGELSAPGPNGDQDPPGRPTRSFPDPWHDAASFWNVTNPEGILQWDDARMDVPAAWAQTLGDPGIRVAVVDSGVDGSHRELHPNFDQRDSVNEIPCKELAREVGRDALKAAGLWDCSDRDTDGHGTWVASRIAGAANGFASNGVAPQVQITSYKVLATGFGGLSSWIIAGILDACSHGADIVNLSLGTYLDPNNPLDAEEYRLWADAVDYCHARGAAVFAAAGNDHVRVDRSDLTIDGRRFRGAGIVTDGAQGIGTVVPGSPTTDDFDLRGLLVVPAGVPGVVMVSATNNANGQAPAGVPLRWLDHVGARDQLAYYSSFGSRIDLAAPGGARRYNIPRYDGGPGDILYGGWGSLGALVASGALCTDPVIGSPDTFACFKVAGNAFGWLQGTSMAVPNAVGVAALTLSAHPELRGRPDDLVARLERRARRNLVNFMGPNDPRNTAPSLRGVACDTGYCHVDRTHAIAFGDAYGAGLVDAGAAVAP
ncbi:MAG: S8 family serine peptidase [Gaiellaceae bacterium]